MHVFTLPAVLICISLSYGDGSVMLPYQDYGDLSMPGFTRLNTALNSGKLDLAPPLSRLEISSVNHTLAEVFEMFLMDVSKECVRHGEQEMAESLEALKGVAPEFANLAALFHLEGATWGALRALRRLGGDTLGLRTRLEDAVEVLEVPVALQLQALLDKVNRLGNDSALLEIQIHMDKLAHDFETHAAALVADTAELLRAVSRLSSDVLNYRVQADSDVIAIVTATAYLKKDFNNAYIILAQQVTALKVELQNAENSGLMSVNDLIDIVISIEQITNLMRREISGVGADVIRTLQSSLTIHKSIKPFI